MVLSPVNNMRVDKASGVAIKMKLYQTNSQQIDSVSQLSNNLKGIKHNYLLRITYGVQTGLICD